MRRIILGLLLTVILILSGCGGYKADIFWENIEIEVVELVKLPAVDPAKGVYFLKLKVSGDPPDNFFASEAISLFSMYDEDDKQCFSGQILQGINEDILVKGTAYLSLMVGCKNADTEYIKFIFRESKEELLDSVGAKFDVRVEEELSSDSLALIEKLAEKEEEKAKEKEEVEEKKAVEKSSEFSSIIKNVQPNNDISEDDLLNELSHNFNEYNALMIAESVVAPRGLEYVETETVALYYYGSEKSNTIFKQISIKEIQINPYVRENMGYVIDYIFKRRPTTKTVGISVSDGGENTYGIIFIDKDKFEQFKDQNKKFNDLSLFEAHDLFKEATIK